MKSKYIILVTIISMVAFSVFDLGNFNVGFPMSDNSINISWYVFALCSHINYVMLSYVIYLESGKPFFMTLTSMMIVKLFGFIINCNEDFYYSIDINYIIMPILCLKVVLDYVRSVD